MEVFVWAAMVLAGVALGITALLPGFHINTLVALALAAAWTGPAMGVLFLSAAIAHAFFGVIPQTYVGVPGDDTALSVLPAQRMVREGRGRDAVRISLDATLLATLAAIPLLLPAKWLYSEPARMAQWIDGALPAILAAAMVLLALGERRKGWHLVAWAIVVQLAAAVVGILAGRLYVNGVVTLPAVQLLPLFAGLFGVAGLLASLLSSQPPPEQAEATHAPRMPLPATLATMRGVGAALATVAIPGLTPGVGASLAYGRAREDPRHAIAALCATGAAHQVLAVGLLFVTLQSRTGLAAGIATAWPPSPWESGAAPASLVGLMLAAALAALLSWFLAGRLDGPTARLLSRMPHRAPEWAALAVVVALVAILAGPNGLMLLAVATTIGLLPIALGTRRVHLVACVALPLLAARLGITP